MQIRDLLAAVATVIGFLGIGVFGAPMAQADPPYKNCTEAHKDGRYNIPKDDPAYAPKLDRDKDGIACEG
ncbi:excalibur calcium-binding domain-containing protein [Mycobacterium bourgelatii]|uniref:Excalibur calcium-binding domain-containing protein n=1 Tax=Mycobacterium bourgelatii TaxID=1273442 RepID=A0A7I9YUU4_MYCBU|nr:excalibur calcium-binding domain-containing protein [Mycobacterium bourgelatii]MCV6974736.1 excalibur calcium-binding domain-containing protein [Mycobacterium bourgelatii]GFG92347.1 hypothetical protein MBOU_43890 [Mycobacterium bourgelatii]